jgi:hypothetical protein
MDARRQQGSQTCEFGRQDTGVEPDSRQRIGNDWRPLNFCESQSLFNPLPEALPRPGANDGSRTHDLPITNRLLYL